MINETEKTNALQDLIKNHILPYVEQGITRIDERYKNDKEYIEGELIASFQQLCKRAITLQSHGKKGHIKYIYISFLRTSIMDNTCTYRLDAYDEKWFLDKEECYSLWTPNFIYDSLFNHMEKLEEKVKHYGRAITLMDIEKIKFFEAEKYHILTLEFVREILPRLLESSVFKDMEKAEDLCIIMGEYMDKGEVLYIGNQSKELT